VGGSMVSCLLQIYVVMLCVTLPVLRASNLRTGTGIVGSLCLHPLLLFPARSVVLPHPCASPGDALPPSYPVINVHAPLRLGSRTCCASVLLSPCVFLIVLQQVLAPSRWPRRMRDTIWKKERSRNWSVARLQRMPGHTLPWPVLSHQRIDLHRGQSSRTWIAS
jgi:hypothetical protein